VLEEDGQIMYVGNLLKNARNGFGTSFAESGAALYSGEWIDNAYNGRGILYHASGHPKVSANFENGAPKGLVEEFDDRGRMTFRGTVDGPSSKGERWVYGEEEQSTKSEFVNGLACGVGVRIERKGERVLRYEGEFLNDMKHGEGKLFDSAERWVVASHHAPGLVYQGMFVADKKHGFGRQFKQGVLEYEGSFCDDLFEGHGRLFDRQKVVEGNFVGGKILRGAVFRGDDKIYEGELFEGLPNGEGVARLHDTIARGKWEEGYLCVNEPCAFTRGDVEVRLEEFSSFHENNNKVAYFDQAEVLKGGQKVFEGAGHLHLKTFDFCKERGTLFVGGKKRLTTLFEDNEPSFITQLYDEDGCLMMSRGDECHMDNFDGEWPTFLEGSFNVYDKQGDFMYDAKFKDGCMTNIFQAANKRPITCVFAEPPIDMISLEQLEYDEVVYQLGSNPQHAVTKETASLLRKAKASKHPMTRALIARISRVKFVRA
jgi:antitoxin component YwqK of YwqJK toxin-antitoxin module